MKKYNEDKTPTKEYTTQLINSSIYTIKELDKTVNNFLKTLSLAIKINEFKKEYKKNK